MKQICLLLLLSITVAISFAQKLPIKATRTVSIKTDEGSNMDVDISPDGKTILFELLGDLFTVPATGGKAKQLTRGLALNSSPTWSPDGKKIAYVSDSTGVSHLTVRDLFSKRHWILGRSDDPLQPYQRPMWSKDCNYLSVGTSIYGLAGGKTSLSNLPEGSYDPLRFPSAHRYTYFYRYDSQAYQYDNVEKKYKQYLNWRFRGRWELSPDERTLAYVTDSNSYQCLVIRNLITNKERILVPSLLLQYPHYKAYVQPHFSFSADSKLIFIGYGGKIHRLEIETGQNTIIPFAADIKADLGSLDYNTFRRQDLVKVKYTRSANASPDGKHLVFSALNKIYTMELPNGRPHVLADQTFAQFQPVYSPDGKWIAYVTWCDTLGGYLWRVPSSGGQPQKLTIIAGHYRQPTWSPDGKKIAMINGDLKMVRELESCPIGELDLLSLTNNTIKIIDNAVPTWNRVAFSPDGQRIIYEPVPPKSSTLNKQDTVNQLVSRDLEGNDQKTLTSWRHSENSGVLTRYPTISPDGRFAAYSFGKDLYLVPLSGSTIPAIVYDLNQKNSVIHFARGIDPYWEQGGKVLSWSFGNQFYRIDPNKVIKAAQVKAACSFISEKAIEVTVQPDQVIDLQIVAPVAKSPGVLVLRNARIITMRKNEVIEHGTILIKNGRFVSVGNTQQVAIPKGAKILDMTGKTIMPGMIDMHLHLEDVIQDEIFTQQNWNFLISLAYGVTTARDPFNTDSTFGYAELIETGQMLGPRYFSTGRGIEGLHASSDVESNLKIDNYNQAKEIVTKRAQLGAKVIKQYMLDTRKERQWLLMACNEMGLNMTNEGFYEPLLQIGQLKDGSTGIEHTANWGDVYKDVRTLLTKSGTYFTPTLQERYGRELTRFYTDSVYWNHPDYKLTRFLDDRQLKLTGAARRRDIGGDTTNRGLRTATQISAMLQKQGLRVMMGSHGDDKGIGPHNELWALKMGGLDNIEVLKDATIRGAEGLGMQKDLGSIEPGKIADLIVLNKNPLDDIHNSREIKYVMKDGILYDGDTMDELWPVKKKCPEWKLKSTNQNIKQ